MTTGCSESIDRSNIWKKARERKDGNYEEVVIPVVKKILGSYLLTKFSLFRQILCISRFRA